MAIKGSTTIELINKDGTKEVVRHDNMVTNAVADLLRCYRGETCLAFKMSALGDDFIKNMFGGVLLFDEVLNSDANDYMIPTSKVTGFAGQMAYSGLDAARGSINELESGLQEDGSYKFVWDFSTSQANGSIKSVSLCPAIMGKIGASDTIQSNENVEFIVPEPTKPFNQYGDLLFQNGATIDGIANYYFHIVAVIDDIAYAIQKTNLDSFPGNSNLYLYKFNIGAQSMGIGCNIGRAKYIERIDVTLPASSMNIVGSSNEKLCFTFDDTNKKLIVYACALASDLKINDTMTYVEIELTNNFNVISKTFTNTTPFPITKNNGTYITYQFGDYGAMLKLFIDEDTILAQVPVSGNIQQYYLIDRNNNTNVKNITYNGEPLQFSTNYGSLKPIYRNSKTIILGIGSQTSTYAVTIYVVDKSTGVAKMTNARNLYLTCALKLNDAVWAKTGPYLRYLIAINPFILCTKNNLENTIVKTASQTMKITYTLTEVAESGV